MTHFDASPGRRLLGPFPADDARLDLVARTGEEGGEDQFVPATYVTSEDLRRDEAGHHALALDDLR